MEAYFALLAPCAGNSPVTGEFPTQRPVSRSFDFPFDRHLNKRLSKHSRGWWFETHRGHYDVIVMWALMTTFFLRNPITNRYWGWTSIECRMYFITCQNYILASMLLSLFVCMFVTCQNLHFGKYVRWSCLSVCLSVCLFVCLYGNFTKSQKRLSQSSPNLVTSKHQSMVPASSLDKNVAQITRSRGQKLGQILKSP